LKRIASGFDRPGLAAILRTRDPKALEEIRLAAENTALSTLGNRVYYRGLIEFSNVCAMNCHYCGIRRDNNRQRRYTASMEQILDAADFCARAGYGSVVLQSGERTDPKFVDFVEEAVHSIKERTSSSRLPRGLGITLCVGEQSRQTLRRFRSAGAHRYLLRIESTNPGLFRSIHPEGQSLESRMKCLHALREEGYAVGTGVMIGLPGQTPEMLADDLLFYREHDFDMFGMGPFIPHPDTPMGSLPVLPCSERIRLSLLMIGLTRLLTKDTNIAATTALQALDPLGREAGLTWGANVIMPSLTPAEYRKDYLLYQGKPCTEEGREDCMNCLRARVESTGRVVAADDWGDPVHYTSRLGKEEQSDERPGD
jgi:biotin synthase